MSLIGENIPLEKASIEDAQVGDADSAASRRAKESDRQNKLFGRSARADFSPFFLRSHADVKSRGSPKLSRSNTQFNTPALALSVNEILRLQNELEMVAESEATQKEQAQLVGMELENLKENLAETQLPVENMKTGLESVKTTVEALRLEEVKATASYNSIAAELDQSRAWGTKPRPELRTPMKLTN
ncbi:hypothetical protein MLD38_009619 [Melastoma candidum]|uniref:Uncharacterized protein n=1 Tax=Melastoma candidum TaxID=119954 RepID=A0ACB9S2G3_9MYRT|nr:hypothetical protein MLD38_009619 [Melastoma candidum]